MLGLAAALFLTSAAAIQSTQSYTIPTAYSATSRMVSEDNRIWFVEYNTNKIGMLDKRDGSFREFHIPTKGSQPSDITLGPDGSLWFTQQDANQIGRFNPATNTFKEYDIPTVNSLPARIVYDQRGSLWISEHYGNKLARFNITEESFTEFEIPTPSSRPSGIAVDGDGNVWFMETEGNKLGVLHPESGSFTEMELPEVFEVPVDLTIDQKGNIWFGGRRDSKLITYNTLKKVFDMHPIPGGGVIGGISVDDSGRILFALENPGKIGLFDPANKKFKIVKPVLEASKPYDIETDDEGNIWFADMKRNALCRLDGQVMSLLK